ncbi:MAG: outer membrane beta-barrel protein [Mariniblastus sp.]|nr:outer membrane beta-barrel protein [Mariniblastus sp.]
MGRVLGWLMVCLLPAITPLMAQENPDATSPDPATDAGRMFLETLLGLPDQATDTNKANATVDDGSMKLEGPERVAPNRSWGGAFQPARVGGSPMDDRLPVGTPRTALVEVTPATSGRQSDTESPTRLEQGLLEDFLKAYDQRFSQVGQRPDSTAGTTAPAEPAAQDAGDRPVARMAQKSLEKPSMTLKFDGPSRHLIEMSPPAELVGSIENPPVLGLFAPADTNESPQPDAKRTQAANAPSSSGQTAPESLASSDEPSEGLATSRESDAPQTDPSEALTDSFDPKLQQAIIVTAELPIRHFPIEPLVQPLLSMEPAAGSGQVNFQPQTGSPTARTLDDDRLSRASIKAVPALQPIVSIDQPLDPTVLPELERRLLEQQQLDGQPVSANSESLVAVATIDFSSTNATDRNRTVLPGQALGLQEPGRVAGNEQSAPGPSIDSRDAARQVPVGPGTAPLGNLDSVMPLSTAGRSARGSEYDWYGLRRPEVFYSVFGGATSVINLVDQGTYIENPPLREFELETIFEFEDSFSLGIAAGQIRGPHLRTEIELSFRSNRAEQLTLSQPQSSAQFPLEGKLNSMAGMANAYWEFVGFPLRDLKPYIGGGVGFSLFQSDLVYANQPVLDATFETDSAVAYQGMAGLNWCTGPGTSLFLEYRYFGSSPMVYKVGALVNRFEYRTDNVFVGVRFKF